MIKNKIISIVMPWHISQRGGGAEVQANFLAAELAIRGYAVHYICQTAEASKTNTSEEVNGFTIHWLPASGKFQWLDQQKYYKKLVALQPQWVIQRMSSNVSYVIGKYCQAYQAKFVWICTDNNNPTRTYHRHSFSQKYPFKFSNAAKYWLFWLNANIMDYYRNKGMKKVNVAFTQNDIQKSLVKQNFKLDSHRMISGHPQPKFILPTIEKFRKKTILWAANWGSHKRPELFMKLASKCSDTDFEFIMVGGHSDKAYVANLMKKCPSNVQVTGQLPFDEALHYFDDATLFVNTSAPGGDGFPNTYIQAWLRGGPVITFGFDPDHIITKNQLGYCVQTAEEAQEKIRQLMQDEQLYAAISNNCFQYANNHFTIEKMADNFLNVLGC
jgi:glycosyltransferase involved in cell wall biosynthesis